MPTDAGNSQQKKNALAVRAAKRKVDRHQQTLMRAAAKNNTRHAWKPQATTTDADISFNTSQQAQIT